MPPLLCVTVTGATTAELRRRRDAVTEDADLIELRLDTVSDPDVAGALADRRRPVIVTCRPAWEGGRFRGSEEERRRLLTEALEGGAEYVDIEWRAHFDDIVASGGGRRIVLSTHDFDMMPIDLVARVHAMRSTGAEIVKLAVKTTRLTDCLPLLELSSASDTRSGLVIIGMGECGLATRILAARFGSKWVYAGALADVGQLTPQRLLDEFGFRTLSAATDVYGIVGRPVAHSVSPAMHNAAFRAAHLDAVYLPFPAVDADDFVAFARALGVRGASVTTPYKVALYERVDEADAVARRIGAINTISVEEGRWIGGNTDASAFLEPLRRRGSLDGTRVAVLGAGGAARAVAIALASTGAAVAIHARDRGRAEEVARLGSAQAGEWPPPPQTWDLLVNCTPVGMYPRVNDTPLPVEQLTGRTIYDLVYNPPLTRLLRDATTAGCQTIGGLEMLVAQAHEQFHLWTGVRPAAGVMREAALRRLAEFIRDEDHVI